jgi:tetratricopeptide (TPR) repeat protein
VETHRNTLVPLTAIASIYTQNAQYDTALRFLEEAAKINPRSSQVWTKTGDLYVLRNEPGQAIAAYNAALDLKPDDAEAACGLAAAAWAANQHAKALQLLQALLTNSPNSASIHAALSLVYAAENQPDQATKHAEAANALRWGAVDEFRKRGLFRSSSSH